MDPGVRSSGSNRTWLTLLIPADKSRSRAKWVRKALTAQSRQLGAKPHWNGSRLHNSSLLPEYPITTPSTRRLATEVVPNEVRKALIAQSRQQAQRLPDEALTSAPWYYPFATHTPATTKRGRGRASDARSAGVHGINASSPPPINSSGGPRQCRSRAQTGVRKAAGGSAGYPG